MIATLFSFCVVSLLSSSDQKEGCQRIRNHQNQSWMCHGLRCSDIDRQVPPRRWEAAVIKH